jgi:hypothetical protein
MAGYVKAQAPNHLVTIGSEVGLLLQSGLPEQPAEEEAASTRAGWWR